MFLMKHKFFLVLLLLFTTSLFAKPTICLNMIIKDESHVITRCLDSVKPIIDYWVIVDTGSTDGTQEIVRAHMSDIPGELHERPWKNFSYNRTEALELAKEKGDFLLFIDADDWYEYDEGFQLPDLTADSYSIKFGSNNFSYYKPQLVRTSLPWRWESVLHEYLTCNVPAPTVFLENITYVIGGDGARSQDPEKYLKCAQLLEDALKEEPDNCRYVFYLAESYRDAGEHAKALQWYRKRVQMGGWDEEVFCAMLYIGKMLSSLNVDKTFVAENYYRAHVFRPHRPEPIYYLSECYNQMGRFDLAYALIKSWDYIPKPANSDVLFVEDWTTNWGIPFQLSISAYYLEHYQESVDICDVLLDCEGILSNFYEQTQKNREFSVEKLKEIAIIEGVKPKKKPFQLFQRPSRQKSL